MVDQAEIHRKVASGDVGERREGVEQLRSNFAILSDKKQAWDDLIRLTGDDASNVRWDAVDVISTVFQHVLDKDAAWEDLIWLTRDKNSDVRRGAADALSTVFQHVLDKDAAWEDLHRLTCDEDSSVRSHAADVLGSVFQHVPDKDAAWEDLHRLTGDEDNDVRWDAARALSTAFQHVPDKDEARKDLYRLKGEEDSRVREAADGYQPSAYGFATSRMKEVASDLPVPHNVSEIVEDELNELAIGRILFNPPNEMKAAVVERVEVRIAKTIIGDLTMGLRGRGEPKIEEIRVGTSMKARLTGDNFDISSPSTENQLVAGTGFTHWEWDVTPLKRGIQRLLLTVTVRIKIPNYCEEEKDYPVFEREIKVKVNRIHSTKNFIISYWQWIVAMIVSSGIIGWIVKNL